jgi:hypothetical protein
MSSTISQERTSWITRTHFRLYHKNSYLINRNTSYVYIVLFSFFDRRFDIDFASNSVTVAIHISTKLMVKSLSCIIDIPAVDRKNTKKVVPWEIDETSLEPLLKRHFGADLIVDWIVPIPNSNVFQANSKATGICLGPSIMRLSTS